MSRPVPPVGEFEHLLLLAVLQCRQDETEAYTVPIRQMLIEKTGRTVARGAVHTSLDRLEAKGLVCSTMGNRWQSEAGAPGGITRSPPWDSKPYGRHRPRSLRWLRVSSHWLLQKNDSPQTRRTSVEPSPAP